MVTGAEGVLDGLSAQQVRRDADGKGVRDGDRGGEPDRLTPR